MKSLYELAVMIVKAIAGLFPPKKFDPTTHRSWQMRVFASFVALWFVVASSLSIATGMASSAGVPRVATKGDVDKMAPLTTVQALVADMNEIKSTFKHDRDERLENDIRDLRMKYCGAKDGLRDEYLNQLADDFVKYQRRHNGTNYPMSLPPVCPS